MIGENLLGPEPTLLPTDDEVTAALAAGAEPAAVVRAHPESSLAWALLADEADAEGREIEAYAFARVGYHRGLDALRRAAASIGEDAETERLTEFLNGADPAAIAAIEVER